MKLPQPIQPLLSTLLIVLLFSCSDPSQENAFYVSTTGKDTNPGTLDSPFKTLEKAQEAVRQLKSVNGLPPEGLTINLRGGIYPITETLQFTSEDAGTSDTPIVWQAYQDEEVILTGGQVVSQFTSVQDPLVLRRLPPEAHPHVVQADLKTQGITHFGERKRSGFGEPITPTALEVFFRGKPMTLARYPNEGWVTIAGVPQTGDLKNQGDVANPGARFNGIPAGRHYGRFTYEGDRPRRWQAPEDIWLHGYWTWDWADMYQPIERIDPDTREIYLVAPYHRYGFRQGQRYYYLNVLEELDQPGEWYLERATGILYFWPPETPRANDVLVSVLENPMIRIEEADYIRFRRIMMEATRGTALEIRGGSHITFAGCTFRNIGTHAIWVEGGTDHTIQSCDLYHIGDGGIHIAGGERKTLTPGNHQVNNCHIHHYSRVNKTYRPAINLSGVGNRLTHNYIHDAPHMGVLFSGNNHLLEYNETHDVAQETGDVGAFYIGRDWTCRGNVIRHNYFHHLEGPGLHGVMAVYLDDWASGTTIYGNVFYQSGRSAFVGGGRNNTIENNLFVACEPSVHVDARGLGWASYYFDRENENFRRTLFDRMDSMNFRTPPFSEVYPELLSLYEDEPAVPKYNRIIRNVSFGGRWLDLQNGLDFETVTVENNLIADTVLMKWAEKNGEPPRLYMQEDARIKKLLEAQGNRIIEGNPGIKDVERGDFSLLETSPAFDMGFKPIPFDQIGLLPDEFRETDE